jgi:hypothetical protein
VVSGKTEAKLIEAVEKNWRYSSASQIKGFRRCQRMWWQEKIAKLPVPRKPAADLGIELHGQMEEYLLGERKLGKLDPRLQPGVDFGFLPDPSDLNREMVEHRFQLPSSLTPSVTIRGVIDLLERGRVTDHKTTSSFRFLKAPEELVHDAQCIVYSYWAVISRLALPDGSIEFRHLYYLTRGSPQVRESKVVMTPSILKEGWKEIVEIGKKMHRTARLPLAEIEPNLDACTDYGGCPFRANCASTGIASFGPLSGLFTPPQKRTPTMKMESSQLSFAERLQKRKTAQEGGILVPLSLPGPGTLNPPDGTPEFEQVPTEVPKPVKAQESHEAILQQALQTLGDCQGYLLREAYAGAKKPALISVVNRFAEVLNMEISAKGTKKQLLIKLYAAAGVVPLPALLGEPTGREKLRAAAAQERADKTPPEAAQAETQAEVVEDIPVEENPVQTPEVDLSVNGSTLYINCLPRGVTMTYLDELLPTFQAEVAEAAALPFYGLVEYNNGPKRVAALVAHRLETGSLDLPTVLYADRKTPCTDAVLEVLIPLFTNVIERT